MTVAPPITAKELVEIVFNAKRPLIPPADFGCRFHGAKG